MGSCECKEDRCGCEDCMCICPGQVQVYTSLERRDQAITMAISEQILMVRSIQDELLRDQTLFSRISMVMQDIHSNYVAHMREEAPPERISPRSSRNVPSVPQREQVFAGYSTVETHSSLDSPTNPERDQAYTPETTKIDIEKFQSLTIILSVMPRMLNLRYLTLQKCKIDDKLAISLAKAMENCINITVLDLAYNNIGPLGFKPIVRVVRIFCYIIYLGFNENYYITIEIFIELCELPPPLPPSSLEKNTVTIRGQKYKKVGILNVKLLCLSKMGLGDDFAVILADSLDLMPNLETLFFYENEVGERGAKALAQKLPKALKLTYFSLRNNNIPPECVELIERVNTARAGLPQVEFYVSDQRAVVHHINPPSPMESVLTPVVKPYGGQGATGQDYRIVSQGLSFCSKCIHLGCIAYNDTIYVTKGLGKFNIADASATLKCPKCGNQAGLSTNFGFDSAQWKFEEFTREGRKVTIPPGKTSTRAYYTWEEGSSIIWSFLNVQVSAYQP